MLRKSISSVTIFATLMLLAGCELPKLRSPFEMSEKPAEQMIERPDPLLKDPPFSKSASNRTLFDNPVRNDKDRFQRLEIELQKLRNSFDTVEPSIKRLSSIEAELTDLMKQIESSLSNKPRSAMPAPMGAPTPLAQNNFPASAPKATMSKPAKSNYKPPMTASATSGDLLRIRVADNTKQKTRVVIETSKRFGPSVDTVGSNLVVTYPSGRADLDVSSIPFRSRGIKSMSKTMNPDGGFTLKFGLAPGYDFMSQGFIKPNNASRNHRHFIDVSYDNFVK